MINCNEFINKLEEVLSIFNSHENKLLSTAIESFAQDHEITINYSIADDGSYTYTELSESMDQELNNYIDNIMDSDIKNIMHEYFDSYIDNVDGLIDAVDGYAGSHEGMDKSQLQSEDWLDLIHIMDDHGIQTEDYTDVALFYDAIV